MRGSMLAGHHQYLGLFQLVQGTSRWAPTSFKYGYYSYNSVYMVCNPSY